MSHDGVNAPVSSTLQYMGSLYAENIVLGDWMLELSNLVVAESRAWIFQEMSFGELDRDAMSGLFEQLRKRGREMATIPMVKVGKASILDGVQTFRRSSKQDS